MRVPIWVGARVVLLTTDPATDPVVTPYHIVYDPELNCYFLTEVGTLTYEDALALVQHQADDPNYLKATRMLCDVRLSRIVMSPEEREDIRRRLVPAPHARVAIVVNPGVQYGAYKLVQAEYDATVDIEIFTDMFDARDWLGIASI